MQSPVSQSARPGRGRPRSVELVAALVLTFLGSGPWLAPAASAAPVSVTYTYDGAGRLNAVHYGDGSAIGYRYDAAGNLLEKVVARNVQLVPAQFRAPFQVGATQTFRFVVDGSLRSIEILYALSATRGAQCQASLAILRPDGSRVDGLAIGSSQQTQREAALEGIWTLLATSSGDCSGQPLAIEVRLAGPLVGKHLGSLAALALLVCGITGLRLAARSRLGNRP